MPRRAKLRPDEPGRERVLEAGRDLFGSRGFHATSIAEIGDHAGIAKSVLYHYFGSKAGLYEAILKAETEALVSRVGSAVAPDARGRRLWAGIDAYLDFLAERPATWRLLLRDPPADPEVRAVHDRLAAERARALSRVLVDPAARAADEIHIELLATAIRVFASWWYEHPEVPRDQVVAAIVDLTRAAKRRIGLTPDSG